jgi:hypothetical protein
MSRLDDLSELVGFFSYSREDDEGSYGALSALRERIQRELRAQLGRSTKTFRLWQDNEAIASGKLWEAEIKTAVWQSAIIAKRQYVDWREFRLRPVNSTEVLQAIERFCADIRKSLQRQWLPPDERKAREEAAAAERAEAERKRREAEAKRQDEDARQT